MNRFTIFAVQVGSTQIDGIQSQGLDPGLQDLMHGGDGAISAAFTGAIGAVQAARWSTTSIGAALAALGTVGADMASATTVLGFRKRLEGGMLDTANAAKGTMVRGRVIPVELSAAQGQVAQITCQAVPTYDGAIAPITFSTGQSLGAVLASRDLWTLAGPTINSVAVNGVTSVRVNFGIRLEARSSEGAVWPTSVVIVSIRPMITIRSMNALNLSTFGMTGAAATACVVRFDKMTEGGLARAASGHKTITATRGYVACGELAGDQDDDAQTEIRVSCGARADGSVPLTVATL